MELEDIEINNSWIPVKAIRNAADIKSTFRTFTHRKTASSPPETPPHHISRIKEKRLSSVFGSSINLHTRYNTASIDSFQPSVNHELDSSILERKYTSIISRLNEEIMILGNQLKHSNTKISELTKKLNEISNKHALHIQALQERHEQKMRRNKQELDYIIQEMNSQNIKHVSLSLEQALKKAHEDFQNEINKKSKVYQEELENNNYEHKKQVNLLKSHCLSIVADLKTRFVEELEKVEEEYNEKIIRLRKKYNKKKKHPGDYGYKEDFSVLEVNSGSDLDSESLSIQDNIGFRVYTFKNKPKERYKEEISESENIERVTDNVVKNMWKNNEMINFETDLV
ncbi:hypothetical protein SteCoe_5729 [Stentor coeruleus]|uniref:Uncharacterized protein n=1 Tax=Stentor coeruleus TaxID=5963 RepID=A0A1R2CRR7_9CILI|nr:hypothetical protein SteCoe_5729 [Stentor coeruleus]